MKKILLVLLTMVSIFSYSAQAADWMFYYENDDGISFVDLDSIHYLTKYIARVWIKNIHSDAYRNYLVKNYGTKYQDDAYTLYLGEFNCEYREWRALEYTTYAKDGRVIVSGNKPTEWLKLPSASPLNPIFKIICERR